MKIKRGKEAQANIIALILIILIILILLVILWNLVNSLLKKNMEISELKAEVMNAQISVTNTKGDWINYINLSLKRGAEMLVLKNTTVVNRSVAVDVISAMDLSNSMGYIPDCSNTSSMCNSRLICESSLCNGLWQQGKTPLDYSKSANIEFIKQIIEDSNSNIGIVGYKDKVYAIDTHPLSRDSDSLNQLIDNLIANGQGTCISCAINESIGILKNSQNQKVIVLMTDGVASSCLNGSDIPSTNCIGNSPSNESIEMAKIAYNNYKIKIYTIGFGTIDENDLKNMAQAGGGTYSFSDISSLKEIYSQVSEEIIKNYEAEQKYSHLKIVFYNDTITYIYRIDDVPQPFETKTYEIPSPEKLSEHITNIKKVEVYMAVYTKSGEEILSPILDTYTVKI